jgi:hypothetical protein
LPRADALSDATHAISEGSRELHYKTKPPTAETLADGDIDGDGERHVEKGEKCFELVDAAIAQSYGKPAKAHKGCK